jgi:hypothetical protein
MKGENDLLSRTRNLVAAERDGNLTELERLRLRVDILERALYCLVQRERDELFNERRANNKIDIDLASLQGYLKSVIEAGSEQGGTDHGRKDSAAAAAVRPSN